MYFQVVYTPPPASNHRVSFAISIRAMPICSYLVRLQPAQPTALAPFWMQLLEDPRPRWQSLFLKSPIRGHWSFASQPSIVDVSSEDGSAKNRDLRQNICRFPYWKLAESGSEWLCEHYLRHCLAADSKEAAASICCNVCCFFRTDSKVYKKQCL